MPSYPLLLRFLIAGLAVLSLATGHAVAQTSDAYAQVQARMVETKSHALIIGVSDYDSQGDLPWVDEEMRRMETAFKDAGFKTHKAQGSALVKSAAGRLELKELQQVVAEFIAKYGQDPDNRLILYFAMHGFASGGAGNAEGYLVTSEIGTDQITSAYSVAQLRSTIAGAKSRHVFVFVNACFGAAMMPIVADRSAESFNKQQDPVSAAHSAFIQSKLDANAWLFLSAGTDSQPVPDANSPFALAVAKGLAGEADQNNDGYVLGIELAAYVRNSVGPATQRLGKQNDPVFAWLDDVGGGDFVFKSRLGVREIRPVEVSVADDITRTRNERLQERSSFTECVDCPVMVEYADEATTTRFGLARTEVTYLEWDACYRDLGCSRYIDDGGLGRGIRAVGGLTWLDAQQYVTWLEAKRRQNEGTENASSCSRYQIPTKAQWRQAAMNGGEGRFSWGDNLSENQASCWGCGDGQNGRAAMEVASFPESGGFFDMTGNLWEWVQEPAPICTMAMLTPPTGKCEPGTVMGGSFATAANSLSTLQTATVPRTRTPSGIQDGYSLETVGLRVACALKTP